MKVALTGTPGTGKTTVSKRLKGDFKVVNLTKFIKDHDLGSRSEKGVEEVEIEEMKELFNQLYGEKDQLLVEGHLAHFLNTDYCIVLRCHPQKLEERLEERDYSDSKIRENIEAEMIDRILLEAVNMQQRVFEIDTTEKDLKTLEKEISSAIQDKKESYGSINWLDSA